MTCYGQDSPGIESQWWRDFPHPSWGPPSLLCYGYRVSFPRVKRPGRGVNHPSPRSAEVEEWVKVQVGSNMSGTDLCVNKPHLSRSYLNHLVYYYPLPPTTLVFLSFDGCILYVYSYSNLLVSNVVGLSSAVENFVCSAFNLCCLVSKFRSHCRILELLWMWYSIILYTVECHGNSVINRECWLLLLHHQVFHPAASQHTRCNYRAASGYLIVSFNNFSAFAFFSHQQNVQVLTRRPMRYSYKHRSTVILLCTSLMVC